MGELTLSEESLDKSLENAKSWCRDNLKSYLKDFSGAFDYNIFHYTIDNSKIGYDMFFDPEDNGLIRVSTKQLSWYEQREEEFEKRGNFRKGRVFDEYFDIFGGTEVDPESMFVHEIAEFIIDTNPEIWINYFIPLIFPHDIAQSVENINRKERGLKLWPYY